jgi:glucose-1-phosphate cytidylyltransferase
MKVVILAGGLGTRLSEETVIKPKPMVEVGNKPILWHIMKIYSSYGYNDFIICLGYKGFMIKEYFHHYFMHNSDVTFDLKNNDIVYHNSHSEPWKITLVDTGNDAMTGVRIRKVQKYIGRERFMLTYGDGLSDVHIGNLVKKHLAGKKLATVTTIQHSGKFGVLHLDKDNTVLKFKEKPQNEGSWISGGFFVLEPEVFSYIPQGNAVIWEREPMEKLVKSKQLQAYQHVGFWKCMDTLRDKTDLEQLWSNPKGAPWKSWKD